MAPSTDDANGEVLAGAEEWSLRILMTSCLDFAQEVTALQDVGNKLGVSVIISPKFHAELAGDDTPPTLLTLPLIERLVKAFKTHRAVLDFDSGFVNGFVTSVTDVVEVINTRSVLQER